MKNQVKIIVVSLFILLGAALLSYGALFHSAGISAKQKDENIILQKSEPALIKLASIGGIKRDESGKINQTFAVGEKPPATCAT
ncbi:MAG: hypothetical protein JW787_07810 [Sedimentisphaerales bacterium]|nr:hypothetical protein [Sedimentisphaerales bacterium]